jgi:hypothetical protein
MEHEVSSSTAVAVGNFKLAVAAVVGNMKLAPAAVGNVKLAVAVAQQ